MRVFLTGATGLIGRRLVSDLLRDGHQVRAVSRRERSATDLDPPELEWIVGDVGEAGSWGEAVDGCDAVVHLAGEPVVGGRWTTARKRRLVASRVESTRLIVRAMERASHSPSVLVCASATGYYGARGDEELSENSPPGDDFLARLCSDWELAASEAIGQGARVVSLRFGVVLSARGGAFAAMRLPFKLGLGGPLGPASRWFPWVHEDDAVGLARLALEQPVEGPINVVAPGAVRMGVFAKTLGRVVRRPAILPVPQFLLALVLGEMAEGMTPGQNVVPGTANSWDYAFCYAELESALAACLGV